MKDLQLTVQEAIAYSRLVSHTFTTAECILLHQHANLGKGISIELMQKLKNVCYQITNTKWQKPKLKYTDGRVLMVMDYEAGDWVKID
jgi:hypothetical protein